MGTVGVYGEIHGVCMSLHYEDHRLCMAIVDVGDLDESWKSERC